ncbi:MAG: dihydropteroate synthase [Comamonas sp.]
MTTTHWQTSRFQIDLRRPQVMGIVNVTPDSFSDGGSWFDPRAALAHAEQLLQDGADLLDIGGESTRPGSPAVPLDEELRRVLPVLREAVKLQVPISIDTYKPEVMRAALDLGADIINDIWALRQPGARAAVAAHPQCGICLMHMHADPQTMHVSQMTGHDVAAQVLQFLEREAQELLALGVEKPRIMFDAGIGFGKTVAQNFELLQQHAALGATGYPLLAGWSRKSSLGKVTGREVDERMPASIAAAVLAVERGAAVVRVHDVRETVDALAVLRAMQQPHHSIPL